MTTLIRLLYILLLALAAPCLAQTSTDLSTMELSGTIGTYRIGANLTVRDYKQFVAGHYFYASYLTDIPLTGAMDGENITLTEPGGGVFRLHLTTNGETTSRPLTFYTSTGLAGTWTKGQAVLPVTLSFEADYSGTGPSKWYYFTDDPDAVFEARVRQFLRAVLNGDREDAASVVSFPIKVNGAKPMILKTRASFYAHWNGIFTPAYLAQLRSAIPHEMFVRNGMAMVGRGEVWFDEKGACVLNLP